MDQGKAVKIPGQRKFSNIILKTWYGNGDNDFYKWINTAQPNSVERRDRYYTSKMKIMSLFMYGKFETPGRVKYNLQI